jgi:C1A family cysteine protease
MIGSRVRLHLALLLILVIVFASLSLAAHAGSSADLMVDSVWLEDASQIGQPISHVSPGQSFNIVATIKNIGQETASNYYLDVYYDSDYGRGGPDNIAPGEVQTWYVGPLTAQAGTHTTKWVVDPDNQIAELDETNNQKELTFTVGSQTSTTTITQTSSSTSSTTQLTSTSTTSLPVTHALGWLPENIQANARVTPIVSAALPTHFEWTNNGGNNWMTSVKNQGGCGSCVAFAAVGATEGQFRIQANNPSWNLDLSEQHLFSCGGGTCSGGWYISSALNYLQQYGTPDESCSPYQGGSGSCSNSCPDWQSRAFKISSWSWIANNVGAVEAALMNGPLVAGFTVYADFYYGYNGGVYHWDHVSQAVGGHAIVIVGYDSPGQYWIVKNSWGPNWGERGYFRIGFGEAGIENYVASVRASVTPATYAVTFYTDPSSSTVSVDGATKTNAATGTYSSGARVHIVANSVGSYSFAYWEQSGVSVDNQLSQDTYMTVSNSGWLKAHFSPVVSGVVTAYYDVTGAAPGSTVSLRADVQNTGGAAFPVGVQVWFYVTDPSGVGKYVGYADASGLAAGSTQTYSYSWVILGSAVAGSYSYEANLWLYSGGKYTQISGFLTPAKSFTVGGGGGLSGQVTAYYDVTGAAPGSTVSLRADVQNTGGAAFPVGVQVWFYVTDPAGKGIWVGYSDVSGLAAGASGTYSYSWSIPASAAAGSYSYEANLWLYSGGKYTQISGFLTPAKTLT